MNFIQTFLKGKLTYITAITALVGAIGNIITKLSGVETPVGYQESIAAIFAALATVGIRRNQK